MCKISIIVPVYNSEKYLRRCLDSLQNQSFKDIEIIIVNDGSTDNSQQIIDEYCNDRRIVCYNQKNSGQAAARNFGLHNANGDFILFVDSDDYVELDFCEKMYFTIIKGYDIVLSDYYIIDNNGLKKYNKILEDNEGRLSLNEYLLTTVCPWNKIYRKAFLLENNFSFPEGIIYEDYAVIPTLAIYNPKVYYLPEAFVNYIHTSTSTMRGQNYKKKYEDIFVATDFLYEHLYQSEFHEELEYLICYHFLYLGALNFYRFNKYNQLDRISDFMIDKFPFWEKNHYIKKIGFKGNVLMRLFYRKKYKLIKLIQKVKRWKK